MKEKMIKVGIRNGCTYYLNTKDLYVYQQKPDGTQNGWLCSWAGWDAFARTMDWAITEI